MYSEFKWWQGVVEDRNDPLKLGRCRVRVFGYHVDDLDEIPTEELPWATPMQPITSAAMNGIGTTPIGPVEGTWVFGFWRDGSNAQEPVIIGTVGGKTEAEHKKDPSRGFNDPDGIYPRDEFIGEADTNRLARGIGKLPVGSMNGENAQSLINKRGSRRRGDPQAGWAVTNTGVPMGVAGDMSTSIDNTADGNVKVANADVGGIDGHVGDANHYLNDYWNEPNPRYGGIGDSDTEYLGSHPNDSSEVKNSSQYPKNHVRMSEEGHVEEWDDTPTAERLHRYHRSGTFEEIQPDGTRVVKVVGRDYEIVAKRKNVYIQGTCNVTIDGDCRMLYRSDLVQEVVGDYHLHVGGEMRTKIMGNDTTEIKGNRKSTVNENCDLFVAKNQTINIGDNKTIIVGGNQKETIKKNVEEIYGEGAEPGDHSVQCAGKYSYKSINSTSLTSFGDFRISCDTNMFINVTQNYKMIVNETSNIRVDGTGTENIKGALQETYESTQTTNVTGKITITSGPEIDMDAGVINLN